MFIFLICPIIIINIILIYPPASQESVGKSYT